MNGNVVIVRVVGKLPNTGNNDKISIRLSSIAFDKLDAIVSHQVNHLQLLFKRFQLQ